MAKRSVEYYVICEDAVFFNNLKDRTPPQSHASVWGDEYYLTEGITSGVDSIPDKPYIQVTVRFNNSIDADNFWNWIRPRLPHPDRKILTGSYAKLVESYHDETPVKKCSTIDSWSK